MSAKKKIIIVEDELDFAKMVKMRLESVGYEVSLATDTYIGTQEILKGNPDLVVLDLMMPAGGGFTLLKKIRKNPSKAKLPVVILTGKTIDDEVKTKAEAFNVAAIFTKPYDSVKFISKIKSLIPVKQETRDKK